MAKKKQLEASARPRRVPERKPSQRIVEAILQGAVELLSDQGLGKLTTNRIAERAGVSIGSVYQYFPNKQAVVAALGRLLEHRALAVFRQALSRSPEQSLGEVSDGIVRGLSSASFAHLRVRREILERVPRFWLEDASRKVDLLVEGELASLLARRDDVRGGDRELMAFVIVHAVESVLEAAVLRRPELLSNEAFLRELVELSVRYLGNSRSIEGEDRA